MRCSRNNHEMPTGRVSRMYLDLRLIASKSILGNLFAEGCGPPAHPVSDSAFEPQFTGDAAPGDLQRECQEEASGLMRTQCATYT